MGSKVEYLNIAPYFKPLTFISSRKSLNMTFIYLIVFGSTQKYGYINVLIYLYLYIIYNNFKRKSSTKTCDAKWDENTQHFYFRVKRERIFSN